MVEYHIENSENRNGKLNAKLFASRFGWMFQRFATFVYHHPERFLLILICESSQIFVWRNNAFIFFQKSDIIIFVPKRTCLFLDTMDVDSCRVPYSEVRKRETRW